MALLEAMTIAMQRSVSPPYRSILSPCFHVSESVGLAGMFKVRGAEYVALVPACTWQGVPGKDILGHVFERMRQVSVANVFQEI